jgi:hypothetical protein
MPFSSSAATMASLCTRVVFAVASFRLDSACVFASCSAA